MNTMRYQIQPEYVFLLKNGFSAIIGIIDIYCIFGVATAAGAEANADAPRSVIKEFF
jgi:hypothetical protein